MQQLPLCPVHLAPLPWVAWNRHHRVWEESTALLKSLTVSDRAPFSSHCAASATSYGRGPNDPGGPAQPQLSPVRACPAQISPAWLYPCRPRILPGKKGLPPSAPAHKILLAQQGPGPSTLLVKYSPAILHYPGLMKCFILSVPSTALHLYL